MQVDIYREVVPHKRAKLLRFIEAHVQGFVASRAEKDDDRERRAVTHLLPKDGDGFLVSSVVLGALDAEGKLVGAAISHAPYAEADELVVQMGEDRVRRLLESRRTLSGIATLPTVRRKGVASALLEASMQMARDEGAVWISGFMDEKNGKPHFYQAAGFNVLPRNQPIPPLPPVPFREAHPAYVNGQWFYQQL